jgi:UDP-N-acetylglucosamine 1-carboxyvinyltransferase
MNIFRINGGSRLVGEVDVAGSKNTALAILSAVVLVDGQVILHNVPNLSDTRTKAHLLERFGAKVVWREGSMFIDCTNIRDGEADEETVRSIRTSFYMLGPLLARIGKVTLPAPGGCQIGARPVDFHLKGLAQFGADVQLEGGTYYAKADHLVGTEIFLEFPSAGATQHLMATAVLAEGSTTITNAATEPEVVALADFLNRVGGRVEGAGTSKITIMGVKSLHGADFRIPADRVQAATYLIAGAITKGDVTVRGIEPEHQTALATKLKQAGATVQEGHDWLRVAATKRLKAIDVITMPYPGFPTDYQQPMAALLTLCDGVSVLEETIYESRIGHIQELNRMGANVRLEGRTAMITGVEKLRGSVVHASDLRAGAALVLAGLAAGGETIVKNIHFIDRGYEAFEQTLRSLGARIDRVKIVESDLTTGESIA